MSDMSSFISPAPWDRSKRRGRGARGLNMQVCFTCGASVCTCTLVCVYLENDTLRLQRWRRVYLWWWKLFTWWLRRKQWSYCRWSHVKAKDLWFQAVGVVLNKATGIFSDCYDWCLLQLYLPFWAVNHTCQLVGFCQNWGLAQVKGPLSLREGVSLCVVL